MLTNKYIYVLLRKRSNPLHFSLVDLATLVFTGDNTKKVLITRPRILFVSFPFTLASLFFSVGHHIVKVGTGNHLL